MPRIWLDVPFDEKDEAKALGAFWDPKVRRWYAARKDMAGLERWVAAPDITDDIPGEDRSFGSGLFVDLVPSSCWFTNARSCMERRDWERLRRVIGTRAQWCCEACGALEDKPGKRFMEVHERWLFDEETRTQFLRRLILLCSDCHRTTHYGLASMRGQGALAFDHLVRVNEWSEDVAHCHVEDAFALWRLRSQRDWALDLSLLDGIGIEVRRPPDASQRRDHAASDLEVARRSQEIDDELAQAVAEGRGVYAPGYSPGLAEALHSRHVGTMSDIVPAERYSPWARLIRAIRNLFR